MLVAVADLDTRSEYGCVLSDVYLTPSGKLNVARFDIDAATNRTDLAIPDAAGVRDTGTLVCLDAEGSTVAGLWTTLWDEQFEATLDDIRDDMEALFNSTTAKHKHVKREAAPSLSDLKWSKERKAAFHHLFWNDNAMNLHLSLIHI